MGTLNPAELAALPPGTSNAQALARNASDLDRVINGASTVTTRSGKNVLSLDQALALIGYEVPVAFASSLSMTRASQTVINAGLTYHANPASLPFTTTGTFNSAQWLLISNVTAQDLADPTIGPSMVKYGRGIVYPRLTVGASVTETISLDEYIPDSVTDSENTDCSTYIQLFLDALFAGGKRMKPTRRKYGVQSTITIPRQAVFGNLIQVDFGESTFKMLADVTLFKTAGYGAAIDSTNSFGIEFGGFTVTTGVGNLTAPIMKVQDWHQGCKIHRIASNYCETILWSNNNFYCEFDDIHTILDVIGFGAQERFLFDGNHNLNVFRKLVAGNAAIGYKFDGPVTAATFESLSIEGTQIGAQFNGAVYGVTCNAYIENFETAFDFNSSVFSFELASGYVNFLNSATAFLFDYNTGNASSSVILNETVQLVNMPGMQNLFKTLGNATNLNNLMARRPLRSVSADVDQLLVDNTKISTQAHWDEPINMLGCKARVINQYAIGEYAGQYSDGYSNLSGFEWVDNTSASLTLHTAFTPSATQRIYVNIRVGHIGGPTTVRGEFVGTDFYEFTATTQTKTTALVIATVSGKLNITSGAAYAGTITGCTGEIRLV